MRGIVMITLLFVSSLALAEVKDLDIKLKAISVAEEACMDKADNTAAINACSYDKLNGADKLLNEVYQDRVAKLNAQAKEEKNASEFEKYAEETLQRLIPAQRAWITFRDAECKLKGTEMLHGTGEGSIIVGCRADMTFKRVSEIVEVSL